MALGFDLGTQATRTSTVDPWTFTHTPISTSRAVALGIVHGADSTDYVSTVTYGGVSMGRVVRATDTVDEAGAAELWFLGSSIPGVGGAAQTISIDLTSGTTVDFHAQCFTLTAAANCEVIDFDSISENVANPTVTLSKSGREGWCVACMYGGGSAPGGTLAAGNNLGGTSDLGNFYSQFARETTIDTADHTIGWSTLTSDDLAFVALCVAEVVAGSTYEKTGFGKESGT